MAYTKQTFTSGQTLKASDLNTMSEGITTKQDKLVSGTSIKTLNGQSLLGSGNITIEGGSANESKVVDLVMFMGQSNMAGRGVASEAPVVPEGQGYEFRAISDPTKLYNIVEPFGVNENNSSSGVTETTKTGSMVSAFAIEYYKRTGVPIVGVSCSKGGTEIAFWMGKPLTDAVTRHNTAKAWLEANGYTIRNDFMVWCQGETDARLGTTSETYKSQLKTLIETMNENGVQKCFVIRIGNKRDDSTHNDLIIKTQNDFCQTYDGAVMVSTMLAGFAEQGLMKDADHFTQPAYNLAGADAGKNTAFFANTGIEPYMYDTEYKSLYFPYGGITVGSTIEVDDALDSTSENPVQNKVIASEVEAINTEIEELTALVNDIAQGELTSYTVTYNLTNVISSYSPSTVFEGRTFTTKLTADRGFAIKSVTVTMGDQDITSSAYANGVVEVAGVSGNIVISATAEVEEGLVFTFDSNVENGIDLSTAGEVSDGKITLTTPVAGETNAVQLSEAITLSPDESFTLEAIANATSTTGIVLANTGSSKGAFLNLRSNNTASAFRLRDFNRTLSVRFGDAAPVTGKHHYVIVYDASQKAFSGYLDGQLQPITFEDGCSTFNAFELTHILGGYKGSGTTYSDFVGEVYYLRVVKRALTVDEFHTEN